MDLSTLKSSGADEKVMPIEERRVHRPMMDDQHATTARDIIIIRRRDVGIGKY